ncbi:hypothetical protein [Roseomonas sp. TAS13]|uniref:hypothetical protein n=1 Tax=Roseomonas sp. TAS13 TaxID=1926319 RepID=UPI001115166F|nr:hypothetical protein [Roseomonas sp. TAS13]
MTGPVDICAVSRTMEQLIRRGGKPVVLQDGATGQALGLSPEAGGSPSGLLPVFLAAGEAVWREATGKGFALDVAPDPQALLGYRVRGIGNGPFSAVMLSVMEATAQVARPDMLLVNDLDAVWQAANQRYRHVAGSRPAGGAAP